MDDELADLTASLALDGHPLLFSLEPDKNKIRNTLLNEISDQELVMIKNSSSDRKKQDDSWEAGFNEWLAAEKRPINLIHDATGLSEPYALEKTDKGDTSTTSSSEVNDELKRIKELLETLPKPLIDLKVDLKQVGREVASPRPWQDADEDDLGVEQANDIYDLLSSGERVL